MKKARSSLYSYNRLMSGASGFVPVSVLGASVLKCTAGGMLAAPAKDNCARPADELFDNGSCLSTSGADPCRRKVAASAQNSKNVRELLVLRVLGAHPRGRYDRALGRGADAAYVQLVHGV